MSQFPNVEEDQLQLYTKFYAAAWPPAASKSARALGWCACVHTCALLKWPPLPVPYEQKNALALQRSSFRENPTYFLTSVGSWVCDVVYDAIYDWRSEFSHNRQNEKHRSAKPSACVKMRNTDRRYHSRVCYTMYSTSIE